MIAGNPERMRDQFRYADMGTVSRMPGVVGAVIVKLNVQVSLGPTSPET